jgi:hypothetical protein
MSTQESLRMRSRFELAHPTFTDPSQFVRLLCLVIGTPHVVVNSFRYQFLMSDPITSKFVGHYFSELSLVTASQILEKSLGIKAISSSL